MRITLRMEIRLTTQEWQQTARCLPKVVEWSRDARAIPTELVPHFTALEAALKRAGYEPSTEHQPEEEQ